MNSDLCEASLEAGIEEIQKLRSNPYITFRTPYLILPPIWHAHDYEITEFAQQYSNGRKEALSAHRTMFKHCNCRGCRFNLMMFFPPWYVRESYYNCDYRKIISKPGRKKRKRIFN